MKPGTYYACTPGYSTATHTDFHTYSVQVHDDQTAISSGVLWTPTWTAQMETHDRLHATPEAAEREARRIHALKVT